MLQQGITHVRMQCLPTWIVPNLSNDRFWSLWGLWHCNASHSELAACFWANAHFPCRAAIFYDTFAFCMILI